MTLPDWSEWTRGDRVDGFEFRRSSKISATGSKIDGITDCSISWDWATDERVSGSMVRMRRDGDDSFIDQEYIRVLYVPTIGGLRHDPIELGTFIAITQLATLDDGWWTERITLKSVLTRYAEDALWWNALLIKGQSAVGKFKRAMERFGGSYHIEGVTDWKFKSNTAVEFGSSALEYLKAIASSGGASRRYEIACDTHGRLTFAKRVPSTFIKGIIRTGGNGTIQHGVERATSWQSAPNRIALEYSEDDFEVYGKAEKKSGEQRDRYGRLKFPICSVESITDLDYNDSWRGTYWYTSSGESFHDISGETGATYTFIERVYVDGVEAEGWELSRGIGISWDEAPYEGARVDVDGIWVRRPLEERRENAQAAVTAEAARRLSDLTDAGNVAPVWTVPLSFLPIKPNFRYRLELGDGRNVAGVCEKIDYRIKDGTLSMQAAFRETSDTIDE